MSDKWTQKAARLLPCVFSELCTNGEHNQYCPAAFIPAVAAELEKAEAEHNLLRSNYKSAVVELVKLRAEVARLTAERDEREEQIVRCCKELGDAGVLITDGPIDGIVTLIDERDAARLIIAERDTAVAYWKRIEVHHGKTETEARGNKNGTLEQQIEYWRTRYYACSKLADAWEETYDAAVVQGLEIALNLCVTNFERDKIAAEIAKRQATPEGQ